MQDDEVKWNVYGSQTDITNDGDTVLTREWLAATIVGTERATKKVTSLMRWKSGGGASYYKRRG